MLQLSLEDIEWPWVALVCMQMVVLMPIEISPCPKILPNLPHPTLNVCGCAIM